MAIRGPRTEAVEILEQIKNMLKEDLKLTLSMEKTKLTNPRTEFASFLGTLIHISSHVYSTLGKNHQRLRVKSQLRLLAPLDKIYKKLTITGFMSAKYKTGIPKYL